MTIARFLLLFLLGGALWAEPTPVVTMVVDPDWYPYESIDAQGRHEGIAAELVQLIAERSGVSIKLLRTRDWDESLSRSKAGDAQIISFLNLTKKREEWLTFTDPYFTDPNVFITREEHDYISDPARLLGETVALPEGTSIEERLRAEYPNLGIVLTKSEKEALRLVDQRKADMTLRSLTMAAYTIKKEGLFNLKIAGQIPTFTNQFRIGVLKSESELRDRLNRGVASITPQEVQAAVNRHIAIQVQAGIDYRLAAGIGGGALVLGLLAAVWIFQLRRHNVALARHDAEKALILQEVHHRIKNNMGTVQGLLYLQASRMSDPQAVAALEDAQNRVQSMMVLYDRLYRSQEYGSVRVSAYFSDLVDRILENFPGTASITVEKRLADFTLSADQLQPLGILVNELLTNTMKYAFVGRNTGRIAVEVSLSNAVVSVILEDDGPGLPESVDFHNSTGFGLQLVGMLAQQLGGKVRIDRGSGGRFVLTFPHRGP